jgi:hypothetical protein
VRATPHYTVKSEENFMSGKSPLRVAVWSTGWIGSVSIGAAHRRPDMELVGVWVHSADKVGKDAGELAGIGPIGLKATNNVDEILAKKPQCIIYGASGPTLDAAAVPDYIRFLEAGINVVTSTSWKLIFPPAYDEKLRKQLEAAAKKGGATLYASGIEPGFSGDQLPLLLTTLSNKIKKIKAAEYFQYDLYGNEYIMKEVMGFGLPLDAKPMYAFPGAQTEAWGPAIHMIAAGLDVKLDEIREIYERRPTDRTLKVAMGTVEKGTCGAVLLQTIGVVNGKEAIVIEHVNRLARDLAPEWPIGPNDATYKVIIEGDPDMDCTLMINHPTGPMAGGMVGTAMRLVNAVPFVVEAKPGLTSSLELPLTLPRHAFV